MPAGRRLWIRSSLSYNISHGRIYGRSRTASLRRSGAVPAGRLLRNPTFGNTTKLSDVSDWGLLERAHAAEPCPGHRCCGRWSDVFWREPRRPGSAARCWLSIAQGARIIEQDSPTGRHRVIRCISCAISVGDVNVGTEELVPRAILHKLADKKFSAERVKRCRSVAERSYSPNSRRSYFVDLHALAAVSM